MTEPWMPERRVGPITDSTNVPADPGPAPAEALPQDALAAAEDAAARHLAGRGWNVAVASLYVRDVLQAGGAFLLAAGRSQARGCCDEAVDSDGHAHGEHCRFLAGIRAGRSQAAALDGAAFSVWLHGKWRWLTKSMTTEEKEAFADAVDRHMATWPPEDRGSPVERWWRDEARIAEGENTDGS